MNSNKIFPNNLNEVRTNNYTTIESLNNILEIERAMTNVSIILINEDIVKNKLNWLRKDKVVDPNGIHLKFLRECAEWLAGPFTKLFNLSLRNGVLPKFGGKQMWAQFLRKGQWKKWRIIDL